MSHEQVQSPLAFPQITLFPHKQIQAYVTFSFAPAACNKLAHVMGTLGARRRVELQTWGEELPDDVIIRLASVSAGPS